MPSPYSVQTATSQTLGIATADQVTLSQHQRGFVIHNRGTVDIWYTFNVNGAATVATVAGDNCRFVRAGTSVSNWGDSTIPAASGLVVSLIASAACAYTVEVI